MSEGRPQIKSINLSAEVHEALVRLSYRDKLDLNKLVERAVEKFVVAELHAYRLSHKHLADLRILKNLEETLGKVD